MSKAIQMSRTGMRSVRVSVSIFSVALLVTACQKHEAPPPEANVANTAEEAAPRPAPPPKPQPLAVPPKPKAVTARPPPEVPADQQVIDDADATGMTSHVSRDQGADGND